MTALEAVSLIRDIVLIVAGVTVTIVSAVLLQKSNRIVKRVEASFDKIDAVVQRLEASFDQIVAVGRGIGQVAQAVADVAAPPVVKKGARILRMAFRGFRRGKQPS